MIPGKQRESSTDGNFLKCWNSECSFEFQLHDLQCDNTTLGEVQASLPSPQFHSWGAEQAPIMG